MDFSPLTLIWVDFFLFIFLLAQECLPEATFPYGYLVIKESVVSEQPRLVDQSLTVERATRLSNPTTRAPEPG